MADGVTLSYAAPTPPARAASITAIEGGFKAIIPALPAWARLLPRSIELVVTLSLASGVVWVAAFIGRDLGAGEPIVYLVWLLAGAAVLAWVRVELRSFVVACRFGHLPTVIAATASDLSIEFVGLSGPKREVWPRNELAGVEVTRLGRTMTLRILLRLTARSSDWDRDPLELRFFAPDQRFATQLQERLSLCTQAAQARSPEAVGQA